MEHTLDELRQKQAMPLEAKIQMTKQRIKLWYENWHRFDIVNLDSDEHRFVTECVLGKPSDYEPNLKKNEAVLYEYDGACSVSFSGGKDSTVLLHIARQMYPDIEAVFVNTGLEYPEIQSFVKSFDNVTILRPTMPFNEVLSKYGYPFISKDTASRIYEVKKSRAKGEDYTKLKQWELLNGIYTYNGNKSPYNCEKYFPLIDGVDFEVSNQCCIVNKEKPSHQYAKKSGKMPIIATMADESERRKSAWLHTGCNAWETAYPVSKPMSFWTEQDVLRYIKENDLPIASVYGDVVYTDGDCFYDEALYPDMELTTTGAKRTGCIFCGFGAHLEKEPTRFQRLKETHPKQYAYCMSGGAYDEQGIWKPSKEGLGMRHIIDELNGLYGQDFIRYE